MAADPDCATCGGRGYLESEDWHDVDYHDCPACATPEPQAVTAEDYQKAIRTAKQMPKEKRNLDVHMDYMSENGARVEREYRFHPKRRWRFDYALTDWKIAVEFDGLYGGGAHTSVKMVAKDSEKLNQAQILGWIVIRVNSQSLRDGTGYRDIDEAIQKRATSSSAATTTGT